MRKASIACFGVAVILAAEAALGQAVPLDVRDVRPGPAAVIEVEDGVLVEWPDETGREWHATFSLDPDRPLIASITAGDAVVVSAVRPFYQVETGTRRRGWNAFFDFPPSHPDGTRHAQGEFRLRAATVRTVGERVELTFDGLRMGVFEGAIVYTIHPGSRLIQQEAVATTDAPDVAYYYDGGWEMAADADRAPGGNMQTRVSWYDTAGDLRHDVSTGFDPERKPVKVRYRTLAAATAGGSVAVFPAPHQYFFPRDFTSNLGHVWHRSWRGRVSLGIRQIRDTNWRFYPWMNAPPGETQRMSVFFLLSDGAAEATLDEVLAFTNRDRFRPLDGYKTLSTHWHLAYTMQALEHGFDWTPPFKPVLKAMGVDASIIMDFHGDGHPARPHRPAARRARRLLPCVARAVGPGLPADSQRGGQRASRRALGPHLPAARLLVHGPARGGRVRDDPPPLRQGLQHRRRGRAAGAGAAGGRVHVPDPPPGRRARPATRTASPTPSTSATRRIWARGGRRCPPTSRRRGWASGRSTCSTT